MTVMLNASFVELHDNPSELFIDIADKHSSERLQCDYLAVCKQFVWKSEGSKWITEKDFEQTRVDTTKDRGMPFHTFTGKYFDKQQVYEMEFSREFHADAGSPWHLGETKEIMIGAMIPIGDQKILAHSHKMEVRLGNEVWLSEKEHKKNDGSRHLSDKFDQFFL